MRVEIARVGSERYIKLQALYVARQPLREHGCMWKIDAAPVFGSEAHFHLTEAESFTE